MRAASTVVVTPVVIVGMLATVPGGGTAFAVAVVIFALYALGYGALVLGHSGQRPLLPAAAIAGVGLPVAAAWWPSSGWEMVPGAVAAMVLGAFAVTILSRRRRGVASAIGVTLALGLLVGVGSSGLLLLRSAPRGFRWTVTALVLVLAPHAAGAVARRGLRPGDAEAVRVITAGAVAGGVLAFVGPPLTPPVVAVLAVLALGASYAAAVFGQVLVAMAAAAPGQAGLGWTIDWLAAVLLAAPMHYLVARAVQL